MSGIQGDAFRPGAEPSSIRNINVRNYANFDAILSALERFQCNPEPTPEMTAHVTHLINGASCDSIRKNADWVRTVVSKFRINCDLNYSAALNAGDKAGQQRWSFIQPPASIIEARREKLVDCRRATPAFRENFFRVIDYNCPPSHQAEIRRFLLRALTAGLLPSEITSLIKERLGPINASHRPLIVQIFRCMPPERSEMIDELISFAPLLRTTPEALFIDTELLDWLRDYWKRNPDSNRVYSMDLVRLCRRPLLVLKLMLEDGCAPHLLMECAIRQYGTHMSFWNNDLRFLEDALTRMAPLTHPLGQRMRKIITDAYANKRLWIGTLPTVLKHIPFPHLPLDQIQSEFQGEQLLDLLLTWDQHNLRDKVAPLSDISLLDVEDLTAEVVLGPQSRFSDAFKIQFLALSLCRSGSEQFEALLDQDLLLKEGFVEKLLDFLKAQDESVLNSSTPTGIVLSKMQGDSDRIGGDRLIQLINGDSSLLNKEFLRKWQAQIEEALNSTDLSFRGTLSQSTFSCLLAVHAQCRNKKLSKFILRLLEETFPMPKRSSHGQTFNLPVPSPDIEWGNHSYPAAWRRELKRLLGESRPEVALAPPESTAVVIFAGLVQESTRKISKALPIYFDRNDTTTIIEQLLSGPLHPIRLYVDTQTRRIELRYLHPDHMGLQEKQYASISTLESQLEKDIKNVEDAWNSRLRELATSIEGLDTSYTGVTELKVENGRSWLKVPVATDTLQKFRVRTSDCVDHTRLHTSIKGARNLEKVLSSIFPPDTDPHQMHRMKREQQQRVRENGLIPLARTYLNADASTSVILWDLTFKSATLYINGHKHVLKLTDPAIVEKVLAILAEERVIGELLRQFIWIPSHGVLGPHPARPLPTLDPQDSACNVFKQKITETLLQPIEQNGKYHYDGGEYSLQDILKRLQNLEGAIDGKTVYLLPAQKISTYQQLRNDLRLVAEHIQTAQSAGALNALMRLVHQSDFCFTGLRDALDEILDVLLDSSSSSEQDSHVYRILRHWEDAKAAAVAELVNSILVVVVANYPSSFFTQFTEQSVHLPAALREILQDQGMAFHDRADDTIGRELLNRFHLAKSNHNTQDPFIQKDLLDYERLRMAEDALWGVYRGFLEAARSGVDAIFASDAPADRGHSLRILDDLMSHFYKADYRKREGEDVAKIIAAVKQAETNGKERLRQAHEAAKDLIIVQQELAKFQNLSNRALVLPNPMTRKRKAERIHGTVMNKKMKQGLDELVKGYQELAEDPTGLCHTLSDHSKYVREELFLTQILRKSDASKQACADPENGGYFDAFKKAFADPESGGYVEVIEEREDEVLCDTRVIYKLTDTGAFALAQVYLGIEKREHTSPDSMALDPYDPSE